FISYGRNGTRSVPGAATVEGGICDDTVRPFEADTAAAAPLQPLVSKLGSLSGPESAQELGSGTAKLWTPNFLSFTSLGMARRRGHLQVRIAQLHRSQIIGGNRERITESHTSHSSPQRDHPALGQWGDGPPVYLLHGFPETWYAWLKQIPVLAKLTRSSLPICAVKG